MRLKVSSCLVLLSVLFCVGKTYAAPTISSLGVSGGAIIDGGSINILGGGFGVHNLDIQWLGGKNGLIETSSAGSPPPNQNNWRFDSFGDSIVSTDEFHSGTKSLKNNLTSGGTFAAAIRYGWHETIGFNQDIFVSWWVRRVHSGSGQWKMFRVSSIDDIRDVAVPQFKMFNWDTSNQFFVNPGPSAGSEVGGGYSYPYPSQDSRWYRMDIQVRTASGHGVSDGTYTVRLYDPASGITSKTANNTMSFNGADDFYQYFLWQNYIGNGLTAQQTWIDDIYIQIGTQARVELGNNSNYFSCSFREIQRPDSWGDGAITLSLNQGSFQNGDTAYLFVVDADGNPSVGYPITIGGAAASPPPSYCGDGSLDVGEECDDGNNVDGDGCSASCTVEAQSSCGDGTLDVGEECDDGNTVNGDGCSSVCTLEPFCGDGNVDTGEECDDGNNVDADGCSAACLVEAASPPPLVDNAWDATVQLNNTNWLNSSVIYCVRLLVEGSSITESGSMVQLGFRGRTSGDYTIRKVSIAERDTGGAVGDVVDSTWTRVTFDGQSVSAWGSSTTIVNVGTEKFSDSVPFFLEAGKDYYVTFKIDSPSVYLDPPASYSELYFSSADRADDIDWGGNGHSLTRDYHALSSILATGTPLSQPEIVDIIIQP